MRMNFDSPIGAHPDHVVVTILQNIKATDSLAMAHAQAEALLAYLESRAIDPHALLILTEA